MRGTIKFPCAECTLKNEQVGINTILEPLIDHPNEMSIPYFHKKVEHELKEKAKNVDLLRHGIIRQPGTPSQHKSNRPKYDECGGNSWSSWSRSHPLIIVCSVCMFVCSILIAIFFLIWKITQ